MSRDWTNLWKTLDPGYGYVHIVVGKLGAREIPCYWIHTPGFRDLAIDLSTAKARP